jgi:hypothetical protein
MVTTQSDTCMSICKLKEIHTTVHLPIKSDNADAWLSPVHKDLAALYEILDDGARPFYEHRVAA